MVVIRGQGLACDQCGKIPNSGLLFSCEQDAMTNVVKTPFTRIHNKLHKGNRRLSYQFRSIGFNQSVVQAVSQGLYTTSEMEVLKAQKLSARQAIESAIASHRENNIRINMKRPIPGMPRDAKRTNPRHRSSVLPRTSPNIVQPCHVKVCLGCRPLSRARTFVSFESVFNNELDARTTWSRETMPVAKASVCRSLGLRSQGHLPASDNLPFHSACATPVASAQTGCVIGTINAGSLTTTTIMQSPATHISNTLSARSQSTPSNIFELRRVNVQPNLRQDSERPRVPLQERPSSIGFRDSIRRGYDDFLRESVELGTAEEQAAARAEVQRLIRLEQCGRPNAYDLQSWKVMMDAVLVRAAATALPDERGDVDLDEHDNDDGSDRSLETVSEGESSLDHGQWTATQLGAIDEETESDD